MIDINDKEETVKNLYTPREEYKVLRKSDKILNSYLPIENQMYIQFLFDIIILGDSMEAKKYNCPNCGAPLDINAAGICPYCQSKIVDDSKNWVMSKKVSLLQE